MEPALTPWVLGQGFMPVVIACNLLIYKELVGERGFEPPTPWSRTRCSTRLSHSPTKAIGLFYYTLNHASSLEVAMHA